MLRKIKNKSQAIKVRRSTRLRFKLKKYNKSAKLRMSIFISNKHISAQVIDDMKSITVASVSTLDKDMKEVLSKTSNIEAATVVGKNIAEKLLKLNIHEVILDRGFKLFHGKIKALADSAREAGLKL